MQFGRFPPFLSNTGVFFYLSLYSFFRSRVIYESLSLLFLSPRILDCSHSLQGVNNDGDFREEAFTIPSVHNPSLYHEVPSNRLDVLYYYASGC